MDQSKRDGYSLVELMIAIALSAIVLSGLLALFSYGARNMRITQALVDLQNQAKDAVNHMTTYVMEAGDIAWDEDKGILVVTKESVPQEKDAGGDYPDPVKDVFYYWMGSGSDGTGAIYFASRDKVADPADPEKVTLPSAEKYLLTSDIKDFDCEVKENEDTGKKVLHVVIRLENDRAEFECKKDIYMRNQTAARPEATGGPEEGGGSDA